ncbi:HI_0552 family protein [Bacillus sp. AK128]
MKIKNHSFEVFDRNNFIYRVGTEGSKQVKNDYVSAWTQWKEIVQEATKKSGNHSLVVENTENWQNSGNLSKRFWSRIKGKHLQDLPSCIAAMISSDNLRVYFEWHGYKNEKLIEQRKIHNSWIYHIQEWIKENEIDSSQYKIWTRDNKDEEFLEYWTLEDYLTNNEMQQTIKEYLDSDNKNWVRIGKVFSKGIVLSHDNFTTEMANTISELEWFYQKITKGPIKNDTDTEKSPKYWLFNVFYANEPYVWEKSKELGVAAMQYEYGREASPSVTKHINLIQQISVGDYIVAYSGSKGLLGYGVVDREFFEEEDPRKFIKATGANWKQRVGVDWIKAMDLPNSYRGTSFVGDLGIVGSSVMSSSTIFEITEEGYQFSKKLLDGTNPITIKEKPRSTLSQREVIDHIYTYIKKKGFNYTKEEVMNLFLCIKTKPFVILSGISGTGKTKIIQWLAESVGATEENGQFKLISIRPDWNDGSDLLGYIDIKGDFIPGPLTVVLQQAEINPDKPFFVLLDEMNLARVEHYFSDILSVMESRKWKNGKIVSSSLLSEEVAKREIKLPSNVYIIGTVNMDETTHPFSKRVLDRASTIEYNRVELTNISFLGDLETLDPIEVPNGMFQSKYLHLKDLYLENEDLVVRVTQELENINKILIPMNVHFGYRVRDEISFYMNYNEISNLMSFEKALDHCILQKILPRISGSDERVDTLLMSLYKYFTGGVFNIQDVEDTIRDTNYPMSTSKVSEMLRRLEYDGFTSFWIS